MNVTLFDWMEQPTGWLALLTLTAMEIVLGIDNVLFLSLISSKLPPREARLARLFGLLLAFGFRVGCLALLTWLIALVRPIFTIGEHPVSWRDIILIAAGLFLMAQATSELHHEVEADDEDQPAVTTVTNQAFGIVILNIAVMDLVFSFDSILTAIGMAKDLVIMIIAVMVALLAMYFAANAVAGFIKAHPTAKVLALAFLLLIGLSLIADGWHFEIPRGYLYAAMGFSTAVEAFNIWVRRRRRAAKAAAAADGETKPST